MKITINNKEVDYFSDYPTGWKFSAGDPFKYPVEIGGEICFIKRFQKKSPADISGWNFMQILKGRKEVYLPTIHDIEEVTEGGSEVTYIFYEHIRGVTLEQAIFGGGVINLSQTADHVLKAIQLIHSYGFWFPDFCEKNIFCETRGRVMLVDLDSTLALDIPPANDIYGSKDYWFPVYEYFKDNLQLPGIKLSNLHGVSLNYLQSIFLVLHLKLHISGKDPHYKSDESFYRLPKVLGQLYPESATLFREVLQQSPSPLDIRLLDEIKVLINKIVDHNMQKGLDAKPEILEFISSTASVTKGEVFTLSWKVNGANRIEVYRNNLLLTDSGLAKNSLERKEFYDDDKEVRFQLYAYHDNAVSKSSELLIQLKEKEIVAEGPEKEYMAVIASWSLFIGVTGMVIVFILAIIALMLQKNIFKGIVEVLILLFIVASALPAIFLLKFSHNLKKGLQLYDLDRINRGFRNLKSFLMYTGIIIIIILAFGLLLLFAGLANA